MSKNNSKVTKDLKKVVNGKKRDPSTERSVQKLKKEGLNGPVGNLRTKPSTKLIQNGVSSKTDTGKKTVTKNNMPGTSRPLAIKKSTTTSSKSSPISKLPTNKAPSTLKNSDKVTKRTPITLPSSRVSKTQYFPSKNMYSNAVKEHMQTQAKEKEKETKAPKCDLTTNDVIDERPRTATLRRSSILNANTVPDMSSKEMFSIENETNDYEDDFDSYESDFEEYHPSSSSSTSTINSEILAGDTSSSESENIVPKQSSSAGLEEEGMLDSGNFDMPENKYKLSLNHIKETTQKESASTETIESNRSNMASLSDEGFEDSKSLLNVNVPCLNFAQAQKRLKHTRHLQKQKKRGDEILNMIRLDHYNFTLLEMLPISYDVFIKSFGNTNAIQTSAQTGEDDVAEEIQTDRIQTTNKWTQFPIVLSKIDCSNPNYLTIYKEERAGVGSEPSNNNSKEISEINLNGFSKSLLNAANIMLNLLYESNCNFSEKIEPNPREIPFSTGFVTFKSQSLPYLKDKPITLVSDCSVNKILTVHGIKNDTSDCDDFVSKSLICIWNVLNSEEPEKILYVPGLLSSCCFTFESNNLVVGGLEDGSLTIWHLGNSNNSFIKLEDDVSYQQPIYTTEINTAHLSKVVAVKQLLLKDSQIFSSNNNSFNNQLCSLDESGILITWVIVNKRSSSAGDVLYWNQLSLVQNLKMCLTDSYLELTSMHCTDMLLNFLDTYHILIATNYGCVLHCLTNTSKVRPKKYYSPITSQINCLVSCPFSPQYFLAGHNDGTVTIYSILHERSLMVLSNKNETEHSGVEFIQWSFDKPCLFYVKDYSNIIHVWDLKISDIYPVYSVPFKQNITAMKLTAPQVKNDDTSFMIVATDTGSINLHILNSKNKDEGDYESDVKKFVNYLNRL